MPRRTHLVIENDVFTRVLEIILDPTCPQEKVDAFADFFAHDAPNFLDFAKNLRNTCKNLGECQITYVDSQEELQAALKNADVAIIESLSFGRAEIACAPRLRAVQKYGYITKNIDLMACTNAQIKVLTLRRRANIACAEQAMMMILALAKRLPELNGLTTVKRLESAGFKPKAFDKRYTPSGNWARVSGITCLYGSVIGIIGMGEIGQEIAKRARAFDMQVIYTQRTSLDPQTEKDLGLIFHDLDSLLAISDWLVPQLPSSPSTENLLDHQAFTKMKKGVRLVNVSRAQCMDRSAVIAALKNGILGGFALDTLWKEPGTDDDELLSFPNVILTPHMAGSPRWNGLNDFVELIEGLDNELGK
jgi:phosphoglycerate dehydrogenase-like enzyme